MSIALSPTRPKADEKYPAKRVPPLIRAQCPVTKTPSNRPCQPDFFSDQYKIRSPVTKNPPSRNRKPRFASPQKQSTAPSLGVRPYVPYRLRRSLRLQLCILCSLCSYVPAVSGKHKRQIFCSSVSRVSGCPAPLRRQPLCFLRPPGRQSVAVRRAAALCVSYENLCSLCFPR